MDAQKIPVSFASIRTKLGASAFSTLLRIKNFSDEPLRLKSGVQLKEGKYIQRLNTTDPDTNATVSYHLYPSTEIPPRSEIVVAAKNTARGWIPTSGVEGEIVYSNLKETWLFRIKFSNQLVRKLRTCQVTATHVGNNKSATATEGMDKHNDDGNDDDDDENPFWNVRKDELDIKANNEVAISIDVLRGERGRQAALDHRQSHTILKSGFLLKNKPSGLGLQWQQLWVVLTPTDIIYSEPAQLEKETKIAVQDILSVRRSTSSMVKKNVFEIHTRIQKSSPYKFSAASPKERDDWIQQIRNVTGLDALLSMRKGEESTDDNDNSSTYQSVIEDGFECVQSELGTTSVLPS
jgi:hypothetical protein